MRFINIIGMLFKNTLYVRIAPECLSLLHVESGKVIRDSPSVAVEKKKRIAVAVGQDALLQTANPDIEIINGFRHERAYIDDFVTAEMALRLLLKKLYSRKWFAPSPIMIIHPLSKEYEPTKIEIRAFHELGLASGARKVHVWYGDNLTETELKQQLFPCSKGRTLPIK